MSDTLVVAALKGDEIYVYNVETGTLEQTIKNPNPDPNGDSFGWSLALDGELLVISTVDEDFGGISNTGVVYVYRRVRN